MSNESKRMLLLVSLCVIWMAGANYFLDRFGFFPKPKPKPVVAQAEDSGKAGGQEPPIAAAEGDKAAPALVAPVGPKIEAVKEDLVLGSLDENKDGYRLRVELSQAGAGVNEIALARHDAERNERRKERQPLRLVRQADPTEAPSFGLNVLSLRDPTAKGDDSGTAVALDHRLWEVVRDEKGRVVRPLLDAKAVPPTEIGQEVVFRQSLGEPAVTITKTYRLRKGADGMELILGFESPGGDRRLVYRLDGPHGLPIEGEWYTSMFREVFIGLAKGTTTQVETRLATDVVAKEADPEIFLTLPVKFAGVENQYFAVLFEPDPPPTGNSDRIDEETRATVVQVNPKEKQKSDVSVAMTARPIEIGPNRAVTQTFRIFAGPKTTEALRPYGAERLAEYRKSGWLTIPYASTLAQGVIAPLLDRMYSVTSTVAGVFGGKRGNYGIAIILLTITVRMILFPLSRKQAVAAKRMQDLQPLMAEIKEKYKDDKEAQTRETFALYKKYKVNPLGGCLLGLIQLPIFVGLWQALNNSVALRHAPFLWIDNLAAPDMMFKFPTEVPILGQYFNLLPFAVVGLMLVQMKLFSPPATTPDQEMSQKMMKYMMVFMSFMFYKVPSGLGLYFITSSTWAICERLLLPKMIKTKPVPAEDLPGDGRPASRTNPVPNGDDGIKPGGFRDRLRQLMDEAAKDRTVRNPDRNPERDRDRDRDSGKGGRPRPKPGRKR